MKVSTTFQQAFSDWLEDQARQRDQRAEEYPEDDYHRPAAHLIRELADYFKRLPADDPRIDQLAGLIWHADRVSPGPLVSDYVHRLGLLLTPALVREGWALRAVIRYAEQDATEYVAETSQNP